MTKIPVCDKCQAAASGRLRPVRFLKSGHLSGRFRGKRSLNTSAKKGSVASSQLYASPAPRLGSKFGLAIAALVAALCLPR